MSDHIDHAKQARESLDFMFMGGATSGERAVQVAKAQVHATLALVEQQRIANLIALGSKYVWNDEDRENYFALLRPEIRKGLGL